MEISNKFKKTALRTAFSYLERDPEENLPKLMAWVDRFAGTGPDSFEPQRDVVRAIVNDPTNNMYKLIMRIMKETDPAVLKVLFENFFLNANIIGWPKQEEYRKKYGCNIPWAILLDPTSACNLHCTGCWAAEYGNRLNLSFDEIDSIITQGKELGVYLYIYTGGEPLVRKKDLIALCEKHSDCEFLSFTNATLIDEDFANEMLRVGNFIPAISIEGFEEATDGRRGSGTYQHVVRAMQLLKEKHLPFGLSCCYTSKNVDVIGSEKYFDQMVDWGAKFCWFFTYMPVGVDAVPALMATAQQRAFMYQQVRAFRKTKPLFTLDFWNDGEYVNGCIAGGRCYLHINAGGDIEPCAFIHYSDSNIHEKTLVEAFQSPLFMAYRQGQPFNENHLRPCPLLDNPDRLKGLVEQSGAHSTDLQNPEDVDDLCEKCRLAAQNWAPVADALWATGHDTSNMKR